MAMMVLHHFGTAELFPTPRALAKQIEKSPPP